MGCAWDPTSRYFAIAGGEVAVYDTQENKVVNIPTSLNIV